MNIQQLMISNIPALLYGNISTKLFIYVHGRYASKEEASNFSEYIIPKGYQVLSFDLPEHGERKKEKYSGTVQNAVSDLREIYKSVKEKYDSISLFACSLGAYFSLIAYSDIKFTKCMFLSPVLDMQKLIENMMKWSNISETQLFKEKEIQATFGEKLSWEYYRYVKEHPVNKWESTTYILYGEKDSLTDRFTLDAFSNKFKARVKVMINGEHYFHTPEQLSFLEIWIREQEYY